MNAEDTAVHLELKHEQRHEQWCRDNPDAAADYYLDQCDEQWLRSMIDNHLFCDEAACAQVEVALMEAGKGNKDAAWAALTEALTIGAKRWAKK